MSLVSKCKWNNHGAVKILAAFPDVFKEVGHFGVTVHQMAVIIDVLGMSILPLTASFNSVRNCKMISATQVSSVTGV